ncbi:DUF1330 domain-containing protein [Catenuloplanes sp. NPDC051500]|uniref:DUF1330 domain-containing protein n=1 Tax=Catenuloplanes sp. NPDC051500 TaxID=3363959 RepID=UPI0037997DFE
MTAYLVIDLDITDPAGFQEYGRQVVPMIEAAGGRRLAASSDPLVLEGGWAPSRVVMYEFADRETVQRFWNSAEYEPLKELRRKHATVSAIVVDGVS